MRIPQKIVVATNSYVQIQTKLNLYIAKYGCEAVEKFLECLPMRMKKRDGRHVGAYIEGQVCKVFKITRWDLYENSARKELTDARQVACVLAAKYLDMSRTEISAFFGKSRHFAKRMILQFEQKIKENSRVDSALIKKYNELDALVCAYMDFQPKI